MRPVFLVVRTKIFKEVVVGKQRLTLRVRDWLGVRLGIDPDILGKVSLWKRTVQATDRVHYTVTPRDDHNNPPESCLRETSQTEIVAQAITPRGVHI